MSKDALDEQEPAVIAEAPDFLQALQKDWKGDNTFPAELQHFADEPVKITVKRMSWADRYAAFSYDENNGNLGVFAAMPDHLFLRDTDTPLIPLKEGQKREEIVDILTNKIPPNASKELLAVMLAEEHDVQNAKNS